MAVSVVVLVVIRKSIVVIMIEYSGLLPYPTEKVARLLSAILETFCVAAFR